MQWAEVLADPTLKNLPYKIELDRYGNILMSPASNRHGRLQGLLFTCLDRMKGGRALLETSIATPDGVKVADVAWCSDAFYQRFGYQTPYPAAPEICVEIRSPSNSSEEMRVKTALYIAAGCKEVWVVQETCEVRYYAAKGQRQKSAYDIDPAPMLGH